MKTNGLVRPFQVGQEAFGLGDHAGIRLDHVDLGEHPMPRQRHLPGTGTEVQQRRLLDVGDRAGQQSGSRGRQSGTVAAVERSGPGER
ncbi:hypothetical protein ACR820_03080 [Streptomyces netropsis]